MFMKGVYEKKNQNLFKKFGTISSLAKDSRIMYNLFHIPRDILRIYTQYQEYEKDKLCPISRQINLLNQGVALSSLSMFILQELYLANSKKLTIEDKAKEYSKYYSLSWVSLLVFNLLSKARYLSSKEEDSEKNRKKRRFAKLSMVESIMNLLPALGGSQLVNFSLMTRGFGGTAV